MHPYALLYIHRENIEKDPQGINTQANSFIKYIHMIFSIRKAGSLFLIHITWTPLKKKDRGFSILGIDSPSIKREIFTLSLRILEMHSTEERT